MNEDKQQLSLLAGGDIEDANKLDSRQMRGDNSSHEENTPHQRSNNDSDEISSTNDEKKYSLKFLDDNGKKTDRSIQFDKGEIHCYWKD